MPTRIFPILGRRRQDLAACLSTEAIRQACRPAQYSWRARVLDPVATIDLFVLQVLHGNTACQHVVHFGGWTFTDSASCQARKRLPLAVDQRLLERTAAAVRKATPDGSRWRGHRVGVVDGSSFSMPDAPELRRPFGPSGAQRPGCGFPVARWLALFDVATGMLLRSAPAPLRTHDMALAGDVSDDLARGDVVLGDRGFCSYAHLALVLGRGRHAVCRAHQKQIVDFTAGRLKAARGPSRNTAGRPHSRGVLAQGRADQGVVWSKPKRQPVWMSPEQFAALPAEVTVRERRYRVETPGFRVGEITLVTTVLDAATSPASALADLYFRRWQVEVNFRHLKTTMKMDVLRCETVEGVLKELAIFSLVDNVVRSVMIASAQAPGVTPGRIGLLDAVRWLVGVEGGTDISVLLVHPARPVRVEPRVVKRRPKPYKRMTKPRRVLRKAVMGQQDAA